MGINAKTLTKNLSGMAHLMACYHLRSVVHFNQCNFHAFNPGIPIRMSSLIRFYHKSTICSIFPYYNLSFYFTHIFTYCFTIIGKIVCDASVNLQKQPFGKHFKLGCVLIHKSVVTSHFTCEIVQHASQRFVKRALSIVIAGQPSIHRHVTSHFYFTLCTTHLIFGYNHVCIMEAKHEN